MDIKLADKEDICNVTALRMMYLKEAYGGLTKEEEKIIQNSNVEYLKRSLNKQCFIVFATHEGTICSCAYLNIMVLQKINMARSMECILCRNIGKKELQQSLSNGCS